MDLLCKCGIDELKIGKYSVNTLCTAHFVIPECFYRESTAHQHTLGFPLKTCGNDMCKMCLLKIYKNRFTKTLNRDLSRP